MTPGARRSLTARKWKRPPPRERPLVNSMPCGPRQARPGRGAGGEADQADRGGCSSVREIRFGCIDSFAIPLDIGSPPFSLLPMMDQISHRRCAKAMRHRRARSVALACCGGPDTQQGRDTIPSQEERQHGRYRAHPQGKRVAALRLRARLRLRAQRLGRAGGASGAPARDGGRGPGRARPHAGASRARPHRDARGARSPTSSPRSACGRRSWSDTAWAAGWWWRPR